MSEKNNIFSFQGVNGAYSELAGKKIYPNAKSIPMGSIGIVAPNGHILTIRVIGQLLC